MKCPQCKSRAVPRVQRKSWMKFIPSMRNHKCDDCGREFCGMFHSLAFRHPSLMTWLVLALAGVVAYAIWQAVMRRLA